MHERRGRQLVVAIGLEMALAGLTAPPSLGQGSDSSLAHLALAVLYDASAFAQDSVSVTQVGAVPGTGQFRMTRIMMNGLVQVPHPWRYLVSLEFNGATQKTTTTFSVVDLAVLIPVGRGVELSLGRQKEGLTAQMMASTRTIPLTERSAPLTAFFPTRDDGARLVGGDARRGRWTVAWFNPEIATAGPMASGANEVAGRVFLVPTDSDDGKRLVQVGVSARWKGAPNGSLRFRAKPESNSSPDFPDTKSFGARAATTVGVDALVQGAGVSFAAEGLLTEVARADSNALHFGGYYVELAWRPGAEPRAYDAKDGNFGRVRLREHRSAWELSVRLSHVDLSSQGVDGGVFDRSSIAAGWLASESLRVILDYGYGILKRGGGVGHTQFLTARVQWEQR